MISQAQGQRCGERVTHVTGSRVSDLENVSQRVTSDAYDAFLFGDLACAYTRVCNAGAHSPQPGNASHTSPAAQNVSLVKVTR